MAIGEFFNKDMLYKTSIAYVQNTGEKFSDPVQFFIAVKKAYNAIDKKRFEVADMEEVEQKHI